MGRCFWIPPPTLPMILYIWVCLIPLFHRFTQDEEETLVIERLLYLKEREPSKVTHEVGPRSHDRCDASRYTHTSIISRGERSSSIVTRACSRTCFCLGLVTSLASLGRQGDPEC
ncbi:uncharacterized protein BDZ99DRAFT_57025 [Mytilinidion resinicola]|uniref:Uncharacterized protein n=1 Tax=Mytilinidion resinicola TaxID=574789 RepID=A0A6A6YKK7_9PEZI|nr:uncharacterized protein BDZ99DRAFT_57025 [Mytilinidion resinicola]KAF2808504.1 hypothetical protein BDZ99DRAFT_57025 [Mytilinidion resinicola]